MDPGGIPFPQAIDGQRNLFSSRAISNCAIPSHRVHPKGMQMIHIKLHEDTTLAFLRYISWHLFETSDFTSFFNETRDAPEFVKKVEDIDDIAKWEVNDENKQLLTNLVEYKANKIKQYITKRRLWLYLPEHCTECMLQPFYEFNTKCQRVMQAPFCCNL